MIRWLLKVFVCRRRGHEPRFSSFDADYENRTWLPFVFCDRCWSNLRCEPSGYVPIGTRPKVIGELSRERP